MPHRTWDIWVCCLESNHQIVGRTLIWYCFYGPIDDKMHTTGTSIQPRPTMTGTNQAFLGNCTAILHQGDRIQYGKHIQYCDGLVKWYHWWKISWEMFCQSTDYCIYICIYEIWSALFLFCVNKNNAFARCFTFWYNFHEICSMIVNCGNRDFKRLLQGSTGE